MLRARFAHCPHRRGRTERHDLHRQPEGAKPFHLLGGIGDHQHGAGGSGHDLLAQQGTASALDEVERRVDLIGAIDGQIEDGIALQIGQGDAQFPAEPGRALGGRHATNLKAAGDARAKRPEEGFGRRAGAKTQNHAILHMGGHGLDVGGRSAADFSFKSVLIHCVNRVRYALRRVSAPAYHALCGDATGPFHIPPRASAPFPCPFSELAMTTTPPPARLCVFDLDGTLADTAPDLVSALNKVLAEEGLPQSHFDEARAFVGHGARVLIERAHRAHGIELDDAQATRLTERFVAHYAADIAGGTRLFPKAHEAMVAMRGAGWRFAICTNKREALARQLLDTMGLTDQFEAICGGDTFPERKPSGQHILKTIAATGGAPERSVMIGDSPPDVLAAKDAGVPVVAVSFGYSNVPLPPLEPEALIDSFAELPAAADRLVPANGA